MDLQRTLESTLAGLGYELVEFPLERIELILPLDNSVIALRFVLRIPRVHGIEINQCSDPCRMPSGNVAHFLPGKRVPDQHHGLRRRTVMSTTCIVQTMTVVVMGSQCR